MRLTEDKKELLTAFLKEKLPTISNAHPSDLNDYILALVTRPDPDSDLKKLCKKELREFIPSGISAFVDELFQLLKNDHLNRDFSKKRRLSEETRFVDLQRKSEKQNRKFEGDCVVLTSSNVTPGANATNLDAIHDGNKERNINHPDRHTTSNRRNKTETQSFGHHQHTIELANRNMSKQHASLHLKNIFVSRIPQKLAHFVPLSQHFGQFGEVVNLQINRDRGYAFVQYKFHEEAQRALRSPHAVCNNRFIQVSWAHYNRQELQGQDENQNVVRMSNARPAYRRPTSYQTHETFSAPLESRKVVEIEVLRKNANDLRSILTKLEPNNDPENAERIAKLVEKTKAKLAETEQSIEEFERKNPGRQKSAADADFLAKNDEKVRELLDQELDQYHICAMQAEKQDECRESLDKLDLDELKQRRDKLLKEITLSNTNPNETPWWKQDKSNKIIENNPDSLANRTQTLRVSNLPQALCSRENAHLYFSQFGDIETLTMESDSNSAVLTFVDRLAARKFQKYGVKCGKQRKLVIERVAADRHSDQPNSSARHRGEHNVEDTFINNTTDGDNDSNANDKRQRRVSTHSHSSDRHHDDNNDGEREETTLQRSDEHPKKLRRKQNVLSSC